MRGVKSERQAASGKTLRLGRLRDRGDASNTLRKCFFRGSCCQNIKTGTSFLGEKKRNKTLCKIRNADLFNTDTSRHSNNGCFLYRISLCLFFSWRQSGDSVYVKLRDRFLQLSLRISTQKYLAWRVDLSAPPATSSRGQQIRWERLVASSPRRLFFAAKVRPMVGCSCTQTHKPMLTRVRSAVH